MIIIEEEEAHKIAHDMDEWLHSPQSKIKPCPDLLSTRMIKFIDFILQEKKKKHVEPWGEKLIKCF
jgi:hypothetical protein